MTEVLSDAQKVKSVLQQLFGQAELHLVFQTAGGAVVHLCLLHSAFEDWPGVYWAMNRGLGIQGLSTDTILICTGNNCQYKTS